jgi:hypothetical protein
MPQAAPFVGHNIPVAAAYRPQGTVMQLASAAAPAVTTPDRAPTPEPAPVVHEIVMQRAAAADVPVTTTTASTTTASTAAAEPPAAPAAPEELVGQLFDPLLRRLRAELRVERDRLGALTDLRH